LPSIIVGLILLENQEFLIKSSILFLNFKKIIEEEKNIIPFNSFNNIFIKKALQLRG